MEDPTPPSTDTSDEAICAKVSELLDVSTSRCTPDAQLVDLVSDSFRLVEMAIDIQDDYEVVFGQSDMKQLVTVHDLAELVRSKVEGL